jgi:hypothetical protein
LAHTITLEMGKPTSAAREEGANATGRRYFAENGERFLEGKVQTAATGRFFRGR